MTKSKQKKNKDRSKQKKNKDRSEQKKNKDRSEQKKNKDRKTTQKTTKQSAPPSAKKSEVLRTLELVVDPHELAELRAFLLKGRGIASGHYDDMSKLAEDAIQLEAEACCVTLNELDPSLLKQRHNKLGYGGTATADKDIIRRHWGLIDIDPVRPTRVSSTDEEKEAAFIVANKVLSFLSKKGWPELILADSGNGFHILFKVDLPPDDGGLIRRFLKQLAHVFDTDDAKVDTAVHNPSRLTRLYGTVNRKGEHTPERPHRRSALLKVPAEIKTVPKELLEEVAGPEPLSAANRRRFSAASRDSGFLDRWLARYAPEGVLDGPKPYTDGARKWVITVDPFNPAHDRGEAFIIERADGTIQAGCHHNSCQDKGWSELRPLWEEQGNPLESIKLIKDSTSPVKKAERLRTFGDDVGLLKQVDRSVYRNEAVAILKEAGIGAPTRLIDDALKESNIAGPVTTTPALSADFMEDIEPWDKPVDGGGLLEALVTQIKKFVFLPNDMELAVALWVLHCYAVDSFQIGPLLAITSPTPRCGKTTLLSVLAALVPRGLFVSNLSEAALFRAINSLQPTMLVDEADTFLKGHSTLIGILNAGHLRNSAWILRCVGDNHEPARFNVWGPKAIAAIGKLPATLADRSIVIELQRKPRGKKCQPLRRAHLSNEGFPKLQRQCARWAADHSESLKGRVPKLPKRLNDRAADNWEPLLSIADEIGRMWGDLARALATQADYEEASLREKLLADIQAISEEQKATKIKSWDLCECLAEMEDRPWPEYGKKEKPITPPQLSRLLEPFGIKPKAMRFKDQTVRRGYELSDFLRLFKLYLPE